MDVQLIYPGELTPGVAAEEYAGRRRKLMAGLPPNSLVVLPSASTTYMSGVVPYLYRQDADFFYLTGIQQHGVLALSTRDVPDEPAFVLFLESPNQERDRWDGWKLSAAAGVHMFGANVSASAREMPRVLHELARSSDHVFFDTDRQTAHRFSDAHNAISSGFAERAKRQGQAASNRQEEPSTSSTPSSTSCSRSGSLLGTSYAPLGTPGSGSLQPLRALIHGMRVVKSDAEVALMRASACVSAASILRCMQHTMPHSWAAGPALAAAESAGLTANPLPHEDYYRACSTSRSGGSGLPRVPNGLGSRLMQQYKVHGRPCGLQYSDACSSEYQLAALFEYGVKRAGASRLAYPTVCASGTDAYFTHYGRNDKVLRSGDMVLMDAGCELHGYASDVTRTWPISGRYTGPQRAVYDVVLAAHEACLAAAKPGVTMRDLHHLSIKVLSEGIHTLRLLPHASLEQIQGSSYRDFFWHSLGHYLGLDTHDARLIAYDRKFEPGTVITVEPGLYIPDEPRFGAMRGMGVRIEDDVLITQDGCEVLSCLVPSAPDQVEDMVRSAFR